MKLPPKCKSDRNKNYVVWFEEDGEDYEHSQYWATLAAETPEEAADQFMQKYDSDGNLEDFTKGNVFALCQDGELSLVAVEVDYSPNFYCTEIGI